MNVDLIEIIISGIINNITDNNRDYIKFGLTTLKYEKNKVYSSLNINRNLYMTYKDFFIKGTKVFIKGYLNSYITNNKIQLFITVTDISNNKEDILKGKSAPHIRYDPDGVMVWDGKRCEKEIPTKEEQQEMEQLLSEFK